MGPILRKPNTSINISTNNAQQISAHSSASNKATNVENKQTNENKDKSALNCSLSHAIQYLEILVTTPCSFGSFWFTSTNLRKKLYLPPK